MQSLVKQSEQYRQTGLAYCLAFVALLAVLFFAYLDWLQQFTTQSGKSFEVTTQIVQHSDEDGKEWRVDEIGDVAISMGFYDVMEDGTMVEVLDEGKVQVSMFQKEWDLPKFIGMIEISDFV